MEREKDFQIVEHGLSLLPPEREMVRSLALENAAKRDPAAGRDILRVDVFGNPDDPEFFDIRIVYKSPVRRIRRITGYLAATDSWGSAKLAELAQRELNPNVRDPDIDDLRYGFR